MPNIIDFNIIIISNILYIIYNVMCRAYTDYKTVFAKGEDGRPHWVARKTCNYLTSAIDVGLSYCSRL